jgi:death-on-curing protein
MNEPVWLLEELVLAVHEAQLAEHGGLCGIRDRGLLQSALSRPRNLYAYGEDKISLSQLAAAYAFGIVKNQAFNDGNKRTAWLACAVFLELNGQTVTAEQTAVVEIMLLAAGNNLTEEEFVEWPNQQTATKAPRKAARLQAGRVE